MTRILVVDDVPALRKVAIRMLTAAGYEVAEARDGVEAIGVYESFQPDMVITDIDMPRMNGLALLDRLHMLDPALPVLLVTGGERGPPAHSEVPLLTKPFSEEALVSAVDDVLTRGEKIDE